MEIFIVYHYCIRLFCRRPIDPIPGNTLTAYMDVNGCPATLNEVRYLEHVQCKISLRFFPRGNLRIDLTSPMGTTSTLLFERPRDVVSSNFDDWPFLSVHFWGEKAEGRWTLRIHNNGNRHVNQPGITSDYMPIPKLFSQKSKVWKSIPKSDFPNA